MNVSVEGVNIRTDEAAHGNTAGYMLRDWHGLDEGSYPVRIGATVAGICSGSSWVSLDWLTDLARHGW